MFHCLPNVIETGKNNNKTKKSPHSGDARGGGAKMESGQTFFLTLTIYNCNRPKQEGFRIKFRVNT